MSSNMLVLDANILICAVLGNKVRDLIITYSEKVEFFTPDVCEKDACKYLPIIFKKRKLSPEPALNMLSQIKCLLQIVDKNIYSSHCEEAQQRIKNRDLLDWPIVATALMLDCPIWTEDQDFFGSGIPTWTTDRIHVFLEKFTTLPS